MKQGSITIPLTIIEASDLDGISDEARVNNQLAKHRLRLQEKFDRAHTVEVGLTQGKRGPEPFVRVAGVQLGVGDGVGFGDSIPGGVMKVPAAVLASEKADQRPKAKKAAKAKANNKDSAE